METLKVTMFGHFGLSWCGKEIVVGRNASSKFTHLLQIVWLHGDEGIAKHQLIDYLYQGQELANPGNSLNNLIFQMRRQMAAAGLPAMDYVVRRGRAYYPDPEVPLELDLQQFRECIRKARAAESDEEKAAQFERALELYSGELLPEAYSQVWVVLESVKLSNDFADACRYLGNRAKATGNFERMYDIYEKAARLYPDSNWQSDQIEALTLLGNYREAYRLYNDTVSRYSEEMGLPPTENMLENYRRMSGKIMFPFGEVGDIQHFLQEDPSSGAYYCSYPSFIDTYRVMARNMERTGISVFMQLCTLVDYEGKVFSNREKLNLRSGELRESISRSLRRGDIFTRYSASQFLILLIACDREGCQCVARRISANFRETQGGPADLRFSEASLADLPWRSGV